jgi:hypothetical protein
MRYAHLSVECQFLKNFIWSKVVIFDQVSWSNFQSISKVIFFLSGFKRRVKQAQTFNFWTSTFEKISKILKNFDFFSTFESETRPSALKILESRSTKVIPNECPQLLRSQLSSIFEFEIFPYKNAPA